MAAGNDKECGVRDADRLPSRSAFVPSYFRALVIGLSLSIVLAGCGGPTGLSSSQTADMGGSDSQFASSRSGGRNGDKTMAQLWDSAKGGGAAKMDVVSESTVKTGGSEIDIKEVTYEAASSTGAPVRIFAYYGFPSSRRGSKLPAIVSVHGGCGLADKDAVAHWASLGYAAIAMDLPGKGTKREKSRSEGPDMTDETIFKVKPSATSSYLYAAVNAVRGAISALSDQKEVDRSRIGVIGYSWGGVITLITNAVDSRIAAACDVYGAGFIADESAWAKGALAKMAKHERKLWTQSFDPSSHLGSLHGRTLFVGTTNDSCYPLPSFVKTYEGAKCEKALRLVANKNHELDDAAARDIDRWFDYALRSGSPPPSAKVKAAKGSILVSPEGVSKLKDVSLVTASLKDYAKAVWTSADVEGKSGSWKLDAPESSVPYFVVAHGEDGSQAVELVRLPK